MYDDVYAVVAVVRALGVVNVGDVGLLAVVELDVRGTAGTGAGICWRGGGRRGFPA